MESALRATTLYRSIIRKSGHLRSMTLTILFLSILYLDYHPRPGKNGGAWMTSFRDQMSAGGSQISGRLSQLSANFTRPSETRPSLLSFNELTTLLHEFGHALHGMFSRCTYESLSGTNVARDFVELALPVHGEFCISKRAGSTHGRLHYQTGEKDSG